MFQDKKYIEEVLRALAEQLKAEGIDHMELLVCGGAALMILAFEKKLHVGNVSYAITRTTNDVDVIAFVEKNSTGKPSLIKASPFPNSLLRAAAKVQRDFNLPQKWLNDGPASVMDFGLPEGIMERVETHRFGTNLHIHFLGRLDQIHFKLYAAVDQSGGKHYDDLMALNPTEKEIEQAARWSMTHDPSEGYRQMLKNFLERIGFANAANKL
ncbi:MAG: hypothetical protein HZC17_01805 [Candidatus Omnitrophica bacterium]|nr:hypothetical protein [Candidatus Omnitrophota bacterium]